MSQQPFIANLPEGIEACRPGRDDLGLPELAEVRNRLQTDEDLRARFEQIQHSDEAIAAAFGRIATPDGLQQRLLERLAASQSQCEEQAGIEQSGIEQGEVELSRHAGAARAAGSRQRWFAVTAACVALLVAGVVAVRPWQGAAATLKESLAEAGQVQDRIDAQAWNVSLADGATADHPLHKSVRPAAAAWQPCRWLGDSSAVAYKLQGANAVLLVARPAQPMVGAPATPPADPQASSGASIGVWNADGLAFALIVQGPPREYRRLLHATSGLAWTPPAEKSPQSLRRVAYSL